MPEYLPLWVLLLTTGILALPNGKPSPQRIPVTCLKNVEQPTNETQYTRVSVTCIYDDEDISDKVAFEYPEREKLVAPNPRKCFERVIHVKSPLDNHYYFSWLDQKRELSWVEARNFCREMCMDLVSLETPSENSWIKNYIQKMKISGIWTSGRLCDFRGCEYYRSPYMWPRDEYGWFWAGSGVRIAPYFDPSTDWSQGGPLKTDAQPDNMGEESTGKDEACLAIMNNLYIDGIHWHDNLCEYKLPFVCEENQVLLEEARKSPEFN